MSEQKLREALQQAVGELEFAVAIIGQHYQQRAESMSVFLSEVRKLLSQPTSDEGAPTGTPLTDAFAAHLYDGVDMVSEDDALEFARELERTLHAKERELAQAKRPCTCHLSDNPPQPCPEKYALSECRATAPQATIAGWLDGYELIGLPEEAAKRPNAVPLYTLSAAPQEGKADDERRIKELASDIVNHAFAQPAGDFRASICVVEELLRLNWRAPPAPSSPPSKAEGE